MFQFWTAGAWFDRAVVDRGMSGKVVVIVVAENLTT